METHAKTLQMPALAARRARQRPCRSERPLIDFEVRTEGQTSALAAGCSSAWLERYVRVVEAAGSNPVTPIHVSYRLLLFGPRAAFYGSARVFLNCRASDFDCPSRCRSTIDLDRRLCVSKGHNPRLDPIHKSLLSLLRLLPLRSCFRLRLKQLLRSSSTGELPHPYSHSRWYRIWGQVSRERDSAQAAKCGQFDHAFRYPELQSVKPTAAPNAVSQLPEDDATDCRKESVSVLAVLLTSATCAYSGRTSEVRRGAKRRCLHRLVLHPFA